MIKIFKSNSLKMNHLYISLQLIPNLQMQCYCPFQTLNQTILDFISQQINHLTLSSLLYLHSKN